MHSKFLANKFFFIAAVVLLLAAAGTATADVRIIYVNSAVIGGLNNGTSWIDAYASLQDALTNAGTPTADEWVQIWVAQGTYKPGVPGDRSASFALKNHVAVYGGFDGAESSLGERDWVTHVTTLTGDINSDDAETISNNSIHVVNASGTNDTAILDGFTITKGYAGAEDGPGGGIYMLDGGPLLRNLIITANLSMQNGGGLHSRDTASPFREIGPTLIDVTFSGNTGDDGGGLYDAGGLLKLTNVTFNDNNSGNLGGGMTVYMSGATLTNVRAANNTAMYDGGGIATINADVTIVNSTIAGNTVTAGAGGGVYAASSYLEIQNTIIWGNSDTYGAPAIYYSLAPQVSYCLIQGGWSGEGNLDSDPLFSPGALTLQATSPAIDAGTAGILLPATDLLGNPRVAGTSVDIGAYEHQSPPARPDLRVTKTHPTNFTSGQTDAVFTITVQNTGGASTSAPVVVIDTLPDGMTATAMTGEGWSCEFATVTCGRSDALSDSSSYPPILLTVSIASTANGLATNHVEVSGGGEATTWNSSADDPALIASAQVAARIHVSASAALSPHDGTSWDHAFTTLQAAIAAVGTPTAASPVEIWVAQGTYKPSTSDRSAAFALKSHVAIFGGFGGWETSFEQRGWQTFPTILSGDIDGNGVADANNSYNVVRAEGVDTTAVLDGVTITKGYADAGEEVGAGVYINEASPTLRNLIITGNSADQSGGGVYAYGGSPTLQKVTIENNSGGFFGGGVRAFVSSIHLLNVIVRNNSAGSQGGGLFLQGEGAGRTEVTNVLIAGNTATTNGGGVFNESNAAVFTNVTIAGNSTGGTGGGVFNHSGSPHFRNSIIWGNTAPGGGAGVYDVDSTPTIEYCDVEGGHAGTSNLNTEPLLTSDYLLENLSPLIDAGNASVTNPALPETDLANSQRIWGTSVDMGAFENQANILKADLTIAKTHEHNLERGGQKVYKIVVNNIGSADSSGTITVTETLPAGLTVTGFSSDYWTCDAGTLTCTTEDPIAQRGGMSEAIYLTVTVSESAPASITNTVHVSGGSEANVSNNSSSDTAMVVALGARRIYVDALATGAGDGTTWPDAFTSLADALASAGDPGIDSPVEIWIADGSYVSGNEASATLLVTGYTSVYGGFNGGETSRDARNPSTFVAVLSGDIAGDDEHDVHGATTAIHGQNATHVVTVYGENALIDGVTVSGGDASAESGRGADGGGVFLEGNATLSNVIVTGNHATYGGGIFATNGAAHLTNVTITNNAAEMDGGGIYNQFGMPYMTNVYIVGNTALGNGGGMFNYASHPQISNGVISGNTAGEQGGGIYNYYSSPTLTNVTISGNSATTGSAMLNTGNASPQIRNVILWGNTPSNSTMFNGPSAVPVVTYSDVQMPLLSDAPWTGDGNINGDPLFVSSTDFHLSSESAAVDAGTAVLSDPALPATDIEGAARNVAGVDMGAYEYQGLRPPFITLQPVSQTVQPKGTGTFTAHARGNPIPTVQWQTNTGGGWLNILSATSDTLTVPNVANTMSGTQYRAVFANSQDTVYSNAATLTVSRTAPSAPSVTLHPVDRVVMAGQSVSFTSTASGTPTPNVQWQVSINSGVNWTDVTDSESVTGSTTTTLTLMNVTLGMSGYRYRAAFTNGVSPNVASNAAILSVVSSIAAPTITGSPVSVAVNAESGVNLSATADGGLPMTSKWQVSTNGGGTWTDIRGTTASCASSSCVTTYNIASATASLNGNLYRAVFTNAAGNAVTSAATLTVNTTRLTKYNPTVTLGSDANPWDQATPSYVTFSIVVTSPVVSPLPTGTVQIFDGRTAIGTVTSSTPGGNSISFSWPAPASLAVGTHVLTAVYGGDSSYNSATSPEYTQVVGSAADLRIEKTGSYDSVQNVITWTITVTNAGTTNTALGVQVKDSLAGGTSIRSVIVPSGTYTAKGRAVTVDLGELETSTSKTFTIVAQLAKVPVSGAIYSNTATVMSPLPDPNPANNSATANVRIP